MRGEPADPCGRLVLACSPLGGPLSEQSVRSAGSLLFSILVHVVVATIDQLCNSDILILSIAVDGTWMTRTERRGEQKK